MSKHFTNFSFYMAGLVTLFTLVGYLSLTSCSGGGGGSTTPTPANPDNPDDPEDGPVVDENVCTSGNDEDCDGDKMLAGCDVMDTDPEITDFLSTCDSDADGYMDFPCTGYDANDDGTISSDELPNRTWCDNCPFVANADQADADVDFFGDACDSVNCTDGDRDQICDDVDNCSTSGNSDQADLDGDGQGDACDSDDDNDGDADSADNCPVKANASQNDLDDDGIGNDCDEDRDGDGVKDLSLPDGTPIEGGEDNCPLSPQDNSLAVPGTIIISNPQSPLNTWNGCNFDTDEDGIPDNMEAPGCVISSGC